MIVIPHPAAAAQRAEAPRLLEQMRRAIRVRHYSLRTEEAYLGWVRRFFAFTRRHPKELSADDINRFLTDLAVRGRVAASTQRQALSAILFLYREVLKLEPPWIDNGACAPHHLPITATDTQPPIAFSHFRVLDVPRGTLPRPSNRKRDWRPRLGALMTEAGEMRRLVRARQPKRLPTVLSRDEVGAVLAHLDGTVHLIVLLLYGTGMRILECLRLRVQDVDFDREVRPEISARLQAANGAPAAPAESP